MKKIMASAWRRGWLIALLLGVLLVGLYLSQVFACQFWGVVGTPSVGGGNLTVYDAAVARLPDLADNNSSNNGWSVTDYVPNQPVRILRDPGSIYPVPGSYTTRCNLARAQGAWGVMAHARNDGGSAYTGITNPHPFVYSNMFGTRTYSFIHNGTINNPCLGQLEDSLGPGWVATRLLYNGHQGSQYTWWGDLPQHRRLDSEYYGMLLAKNLLIGENYYWPGGLPASIHGIEEYAIYRTLDKIARGLGDSRFNSLNALLAADNNLWMLYRRTTADDNINDNYLHYLSYYIGAPTTVREASTTQIPGADWVRLNVMGQSKCIWLNPAVPITPEDCPAITADPTELRVNQIKYADLSQSDPAIAANPADGTFLSVWASTYEGNIWCRIYSQMGSSEFAQMQVNSSNVTGTLRALPAVAFNAEGDRGMIVWKEQAPFGTGDYDTIKGRRFLWDGCGSQFSWLEDEIVLTNQHLIVDHPTVACIRKGYMVAWHTLPTLTMGYQVRYSLESSEITLVDQPLVGNGIDHFTKPDIIALDAHRYIVVFEKDVPLTGRDLLQTVQTGVEPGWSGVPMDLRETSISVITRAWPCIARLTDSRFVVGYNRDNLPAISAEIYDAPFGGWNSWVSAVRGVNPNMYGPSDIAVLSPDVFYISYAALIDQARDPDVWAARRSAAAFVDPLRLNETTDQDQSRPVIAVAQGFGPLANQQLYDAHSTTQYFDNHRLAIWQSNIQDGSEYGIVGKYQGIAPDLALQPWNKPEIFDNAGHVPCTDLPLLAEGDKEGSLDGTGIAPVESNIPAAIPTATALYPAYPNPFNPTTMLRFDVKDAVVVRLDVFDLAGRLVSTLVNEEYPAGSYAVRFDGTTVPSGTYFVRLRAGAVVQMQKLLLVK